MTPEQVRYVLGPPTLQDPFSEGSWRYLMTYLPGEGEPVEQEILVHFESGRYSHYEGEVVDDLKTRTTGRKDRELQDKARKRQKESSTEEVPELDPEPEPLPEGEPRGDEL
jgi:outer membrane protein assembly factor BamE